MNGIPGQAETGGSSADGTGKRNGYCCCSRADRRKLPFAEARNLLEEKGILTEELTERITDWEATPNFAEMLVLLANLYQYLMTC